MSTAPSIKLTQNKIDSAINNHRYIKTDGNGELMLTGASNYLKDHPTIVYVPKFRLVGEVERIRAILTEFGARPTDINSAFASAYTCTSILREQKFAFEHEVNMAREFKKNRPKETVKALNVDDVFKNIKDKDYTVVSTVTKNKDGILVQEAKSSSKRKGNKRNLTFLERFESIESGFALDVSTLTADGKGAKTIKAPTEASSRKMLPGLALASTTAEGMRNALKLIGRPERSIEFDSILAKSATTSK